MASGLSVSGDFNVVLNQNDKLGEKHVACSSRGGFREMVDKNGFIWGSKDIAIHGIIGEQDKPTFKRD